MLDRKVCRFCGVDIAKRPMPHLGLGPQPMWVHVEPQVGPRFQAEFYYRTCMSTTVAEPFPEDKADPGL